MSIRKTKNSRLVRWTLLFGIGSLCPFLLGCGGYKVPTPTYGSYTANGVSNNTTYEDGTGTTTGTSTTTGTTTTTGTNALLVFPVDGTGYNSYTFSVSTRTVLKVKFAPGMQDRTIAGTGYNITYSKLAVYVGVGGQTVATPIMTNGLGSTQAQETYPMDFSTQIPGGCVGSTDPNCRQVVTITVSKPNYDYFCYNYRTYCPYTQVQSGHPWNGTLTVQTDDTVVMQ